MIMMLCDHSAPPPYCAPHGHSSARSIVLDPPPILFTAKPAPHHHTQAPTPVEGILVGGDREGISALLTCHHFGFLKIQLMEA